MLAERIARIHAENLVNYGVLPLAFVDPHDREQLDQGTTLRIRDLHQALRLKYGRVGGGAQRRVLRARYTLSPRQIDVLLAGGAIP